MDAARLYRLCSEEQHQSPKDTNPEEILTRGCVAIAGSPVAVAFCINVAEPHLPSLAAGRLVVCTERLSAELHRQGLLQRFLRRECQLAALER